MVFKFDPTVSNDAREAALSGYNSYLSNGVTCEPLGNVVHINQVKFIKGDDPNAVVGAQTFKNPQNPEAGVKVTIAEFASRDKPTWFHEFVHICTSLINKNVSSVINDPNILGKLIGWYEGFSIFSQDLKSEYKYIEEAWATLLQSESYPNDPLHISPHYQKLLNTAKLHWNMAKHHGNLSSKKEIIELINKSDPEALALFVIGHEPSSREFFQFISAYSVK